MTDWGQELAENLNRNVMASIRSRASPHPWPVEFYDCRAFAVSPIRTDVREWYDGCWHYVDTKRVLTWLGS
jgi:hypothetical protein